ncbi:hypothetical protein [Bacteroides graminisolvens]|nr:hypothetical protein [Bacteroides graminisolvens]
MAKIILIFTTYCSAWEAAQVAEYTYIYTSNNLLIRIVAQVCEFRAN